jgi:cell wall-associated NlpC family hydrolase
VKPVPVSLSAVNGPRAAAAVKAAYAALGTPYRWGGTSPAGYDCSGLTQHVWHEAGVSIPRTSSQQAEHGTSVSLASISPGDLVIFYRGASHVGIYVGGGMVIHAPHTGAVVRLEKMKDMPIYDIRRYSS